MIYPLTLFLLQTKNIVRSQGFLYLGLLGSPIQTCMHCDDKLGILFDTLLTIPLDNRIYASGSWRYKGNNGIFDACAGRVRQPGTYTTTKRSWPFYLRVICSWLSCFFVFVFSLFPPLYIYEPISGLFVWTGQPQAEEEKGFWLLFMLVRWVAVCASKDN